MMKKCHLILFFISFLIFNNPFLAVAEPDGYLKKGTYAISPKTKTDIFLYVPGKTLLYDIQDDKVLIGSRAFPQRRRNYLRATTQDGIETLVWENEVRRNPDNFSKYDFFVNRRIPLCLTSKSCNEIWEKFNRKSDEGDGWLAIWPGAGGKFKEQIGNFQRVAMDTAGGWEEGFIPATKGGLSIEDHGYITNLKRAFPLYKFESSTIDDLSSRCGSQTTNISMNEIYSKIEILGKTSAIVSVDPAAALIKVIPKKYLKLILETLGLEASLNLEALFEGSWRKEKKDTAETTISYGNTNECWGIEDVFIQKRTISQLGTDSDYAPYGRILIKKVYECQASEKSKMKYASFLLSFYNDKGTIADDGHIKTPIDRDIVKEDIGLKSGCLHNSLVSVSQSSDHFRLIDYFLKEGVPKSIGSFYIKEINRSRSKK